MSDSSEVPLDRGGHGGSWYAGGAAFPPTDGHGCSFCGAVGGGGHGGFCPNWGRRFDWDGNEISEEELGKSVADRIRENVNYIKRKYGNPDD
ncbi:MAG TPA: hypothetical protein VHE33_10035 [Acidobacteriaceae bacterium]|nr:hypothetical protein [Acidobacteriaceae bacterium]